MAKSDDKSGESTSMVDKLPIDRLKDEAQNVLKALGEKAVKSVGEKVSETTQKLTDFTDGGGVGGDAAKEGGKAAAKGESPVKGALKGGLSGIADKAKEALGGGSGGGGGKATKSTNIIEELDVGVPLRVAYNQWTQYADFPSFMKKVENVSQESEEEVTFKAKIFWSHRSWKAKITEQVPDSRIIWRSQGDKGRVDGAVTFHELAPELTRILVVLEYYPQGLFERTGNL